MDAQETSYPAGRLELDDADLADHQADVERRIQAALWAHQDLKLARKAFVDMCAQLGGDEERGLQRALDARVAFQLAKKTYDEACARLIPYRSELFQVAA
jgi:hypothetical protein